MDVYQIFITHNRPWTMREILCGAILDIFLLILISFGVKKKKFGFSQGMALMLLSIYLEVVFASTVFTRVPGLERHYQLELFWSWKEIWQNGNEELLQENLLNMILLFPVGLLIPAVFGRKRSKVLFAFLSGAVLSGIIEVCQLVFYRGLFEWDDMVHNGIGCMVGCLIGKLFMGRSTEQIKKEKNTDI